jgi:single-strand DNA-binding protein
MKMLVVKVLQEILLKNQRLKTQEEKMSLNTVNVMGNLTRDPEIKHTANGKELCIFSIANNRFNSKNGEKINEVSYFDVEVWGLAALNCNKYLIKGSGIIVEGRLRQERWEKDGKNQSHIKITANSVHFLPRKDKGNRNEESSILSTENIMESPASIETSFEESAA